MADRGVAPASAGLSRWQVYGLVALLLVLSVVPLACLVVLWPEKADLAGPSRIRLLGWSWTIPPEHRILLCVAFCGLLGGSIRMLLRIRGDFTSPHVESLYLPWYFLTPPIGAILAVGFYLVVPGPDTQRSLGIVILAISIVALFALGAVFAAVSTYARALIYRYATGLAVPGVAPEVFGGAFVAKKRRGR